MSPPSPNTSTNDIAGARADGADDADVSVLTDTLSDTRLEEAVTRSRRYTMELDVLEERTRAEKAEAERKKKAKNAFKGVARMVGNRNVSWAQDGKSAMVQM